MKKDKPLPPGDVAGRTGSVLHCCGIKDLKVFNLSTGTRNFGSPEAILRRICLDLNLTSTCEADRRGGSAAHLVLSVAYPPKKARAFTGLPTSLLRFRRFKRYVRRHALGTLTVGQEARNPNSSNLVLPAIFTPDPEALALWFVRNWPSQMSSRTADRARSQYHYNDAAATMSLDDYINQEVKAKEAELKRFDANPVMFEKSGARMYSPRIGNYLRRDAWRAGQGGGSVAETADLEQEADD